MTEINYTTKPPVTYEIAQRFLADFHFCIDYWQTYSDDCMNGSRTPAHSKVLGQLMASLLESSELLLDSLYDNYPAEFLGYVSDRSQRQMTDFEIQLAEHYLSIF